MAPKAVGTGTRCCGRSPGLWSQLIQGGPPLGGKTRARAGPQAWALPTSRGRSRGLGQSEEEWVLPKVLSGMLVPRPR